MFVKSKRPDPAWNKYFISDMTPIEWAVNRAISIKVHELRLQAARTTSPATGTCDLYVIAQKAVEFLGGQGGHDMFTMQFDEPAYDEWEMRRAIVEIAHEWNGEVFGEILTLTAPAPAPYGSGVTEF